MGFEPAFRPIRTLSPYVDPPGDHLVAILKAYLDDSGDADAEGETHLTIAGYLSHESGWADFEALWNELMRMSGTPWLHMNEFGNPLSKIYGHLKANPAGEKDFMQAVIGVIIECVLASMATTVILSDLRAFNAKHNLKIDAYSLGIYGCLLQMRSYYPDAEIDVVFDKFDNSISRAAAAWNYARSHAQGIALRPELLTPIPLQKDESWKTVLPLQAAEFIAWEVRKFRRERSDFRPCREVRMDRERVHQAVLEWENKNPRRDRASFKAVRMSTILEPHHQVVDEYALEAVLNFHPDGWGEM